MDVRVMRGLEMDCSGSGWCTTKAFYNSGVEHLSFTNT
jgi:hypothetical protein